MFRKKSDILQSLVDFGDTVCFISTYYGMEPVLSLFDGKLLEVAAEQGQKVNKGDIIAFVK